MRLVALRRPHALTIRSPNGAHKSTSTAADSVGRRRPSPGWLHRRPYPNGRHPHDDHLVLSRPPDRAGGGRRRHCHHRCRSAADHCGAARDHRGAARDHRGAARDHDDEAVGHHDHGAWQNDSLPVDASQPDDLDRGWVTADHRRRRFDGIDVGHGNAVATKRGLLVPSRRPLDGPGRRARPVCESSRG